ncbi:reductive dehalogenase [Dehalogenimonas etheniformans]|uniref:Reductive dehalogenase n=2 Tax=Dehalogenimonas etheniformans TaxID=1536648 RepID=A0A2P5P5I7_9CHLR|nr:reductive dehalogenase [Dehalogenimonas etheniformans]PPD57553.1 reductive dehalogenase [Dehalogenimonas etheniformans]
MSGFHSTLSRRDFMKGLGLAGAGIGVAGAVAPTFNDLDQLAATTTNKRHPWWVKENELNVLTSDIDWNVFAQLDKKTTGMPSPSAENEALRAERDKKFDLEGMTQKIPGRDVRCAALADMVTGLQTAAPWDGPSGIVPPQENGASAWQGTPEDNMTMLRAALHLAGAAQVGAMELTEKMLRNFDKGAVVFEDIAKGTVDAKKVYHIPQKAKYLLTYSIQQNYVQCIYQLREDPAYPGKLAMPMPLGRPAIHRAYGDGRYTEWQAMRFVKNLGYGAYKAGVTTNVSLGLFSGLGEQGRATYMMTPRSGLMTRITNYIITDLPLAPTNPIDFGGSKFCETCMRCAEKCPSDALGTQKEPTWDAGPGNKPGYKGWRVDWLKCREVGAPSRCGVCHTLCPFNHPNEGMIHPIVRSTAATTPIFNSFFATMDRTFAYAEPKSPEELEAWWTRDLENWRPDVTHGAGKFTW